MGGATELGEKITEQILSAAKEVIKLEVPKQNFGLAPAPVHTKEVDINCDRWEHHMYELYNEEDISKFITEVQNVIKNKKVFYRLHACQKDFEYGTMKEYFQYIIRFSTEN
jgi:hypothetical protein